MARVGRNLGVEDHHHLSQSVETGKVCEIWKAWNVIWFSRLVEKIQVWGAWKEWKGDESWRYGLACIISEAWKVSRLINSLQIADLDSSSSLNHIWLKGCNNENEHNYQLNDHLHFSQLLYSPLFGYEEKFILHANSFIALAFHALGQS